jgi:hypothetical protein
MIRRLGATHPAMTLAPVVRVKSSNIATANSDL